MGKKGVILDNGKKAQSSMALYWKSNRQRAKHPKQKPDHAQNQKQITDKSVMSNFQKWKLHKQKIISKTYTKPAQNVKQKESIEVDNEQQQNQLIQSMLQMKKPKILTVPGFKSKSTLQNKLQIQKAPQANQLTNILKLPSHMGQMSQQQIIQMLRQRKNKQNLTKRHQQMNKKGHQKKKDDQDVLLGDDLMQLLMKKKDKEEEKQDTKIQEQKIKQQKVPPPAPKPQNFFKSQILNKIQKDGVQKAFQKIPQKIDQSALNNNNQKQMNEEIHKQTLSTHDDKNQQRGLEAKAQEKKPLHINPKFFPRALKK